MMDRDLRQTVFEIWIALGLFALMGILVIWLFIGGGPLEWASTLKQRCLAGYLAGELVGAFMILHMGKAAEKAVNDTDPSSAQKHMRLSSLLRMLVVFGILALAYMSGMCHLLAMILGAFCLKPSVYLQPVIHRLIMKWKHEPIEEVPEAVFQEEAFGGTDEDRENARETDEEEKSKLVSWLERKTYKHGNDNGCWGQ